jgi:hypothetical protein
MNNTLPEQLDHKYTSSADDVREVINGNTTHCLLPRSCRENFTISFTDVKRTKEQIQSTIINRLNNSMPNKRNFILSMDELTNINKKITYSIVFLTIPKELINKLFLAGINTVNFYVGYSEKINEYPLFNKEPIDDEIAMTNGEGFNLPYKAVIKLNTIN